MCTKCLRSLIKCPKQLVTENAQCFSNLKYICTKIESNIASKELRVKGERRREKGEKRRDILPFWPQNELQFQTHVGWAPQDTQIQIQIYIFREESKNANTRPAEIKIKNTQKLCV